MRVEEKRVQRTRLIQTDRFVIAVGVELVVPPADPSEPCYESETVQFLRQVRERAEAGDIGWLKRHGKVYEALTPETVA